MEERLVQVVILAGGLGLRLRPLTDTRAKPLLPIMNKPMIMHIIDSFPEVVDKIILTVSYRKKDLESFFRNKDIGREVIIVNEPKPLGTGGAIKNAEKYIDGTFAVYNGDIITSMKISEFIEFHNDKGGIGSISLWPVTDPSAFGLVTFDYKDRILEFTEKKQLSEIDFKQDFYWINAGTYILEPEILDYIPKRKKISIERKIFPKVIEKNMFGFKIHGYWFDSGTPKLYMKVHKKLLEEMSGGGKGIAIGKNTAIETGVELIPPVLLGENCKISHNSVIGPHVCLGENVKIDVNSRISEAVIYKDTRIGAGVLVKNIIIGEGCELHKGVKIEEGTVLGDGTVIKS